MSLWEGLAEAIETEGLGEAPQFRGQNRCFFDLPGGETGTEDSRAVIRVLGAQMWGSMPIFGHDLG